MDRITAHITVAEAEAEAARKNAASHIESLISDLSFVHEKLEEGNDIYEDFGTRFACIQRELNKVLTASVKLTAYQTASRIA